MMKSQKGIVLPMDGRGVRLTNSLVPPLDPISRGCNQQESELASFGIPFEIRGAEAAGKGRLIFPL